MYERANGIGKELDELLEADVKAKQLKDLRDFVEGKVLDIDDSIIELPR